MKKKGAFDTLILVRMHRDDRRIAEAVATLEGVSLSELARRGLREQASRFTNASGGKGSEAHAAAA